MSEHKGYLTVDDLYEKVMEKHKRETEKRACQCKGKTINPGKKCTCVPR